MGRASDFTEHREREMAREVKRKTMMTCLICPLCDNLLRDATTISDCLHSFCRTCIYEKITEDKIKYCPVCNIDLGGVPFEKLRSDHILQHLRGKLFPLKRRKVKAHVIVPLPAKRRERSILSLSVSMPRVSAEARITGRRTKAVRRKYLRRNDSLVERIMQKEKSSFLRELVGHEPEDISVYGKEYSSNALLALNHLAQENRELSHNFPVVSDTLIASNEIPKNLCAERNSPDVCDRGMEESQVMRKELEARSLRIIGNFWLANKNCASGTTHMNM